MISNGFNFNIKLTVQYWLLFFFDYYCIKHGNRARNCYLRFFSTKSNFTRLNDLICPISHYNAGTTRKKLHMNKTWIIKRHCCLSSFFLIIYDFQSMKLLITFTWPLQRFSNSNSPLYVTISRNGNHTGTK